VRPTSFFSVCRRPTRDRQGHSCARPPRSCDCPRRTREGAGQRTTVAGELQIGGSDREVLDVVREIAGAFRALLDVVRQISADDLAIVDVGRETAQRVRELAGGKREIVGFIREITGLLRPVLIETVRATQTREQP
jgi:hypothetical protein